MARLDELGILDDHRADGNFAPSAVHVVRLMSSFEAAGVPLEDVARGMAAGELSFPLGLFLPEPAALSETYDELGARLGRDRRAPAPPQSRAGLPPAEGDQIRDEDAELIERIVTTLDLADDEELSRFARLYGGTIQRLVTSGLQFFDVRGQPARHRLRGPGRGAGSAALRDGPPNTRCSSPRSSRGFREGIASSR